MENRITKINLANKNGHNGKKLEHAGDKYQISNVLIKKGNMQASKWKPGEKGK